MNVWTITRCFPKKHNLLPRWRINISLKFDFNIITEFSIFIFKIAINFLISILIISKSINFFYQINIYFKIDRKLL